MRRNLQSTDASIETATDGAAPVAQARFADAVLIRRVQAGDPHAFSELVRKYQDRVYHTCLRICGHREDAADLTQDAFLKAFAAIETFRGASAFYTWIFRIAVNLSISHKRKERNHAAISLDGESDSGARLADTLRDPDEPDASAPAESAETRAEVSAALLAIEPDYRAAVVLRDVEGCDYQEIADILEVPVGTVKSRIYRGRQALADRLQGSDVDVRKKT